MSKLFYTIISIFCMQTVFAGVLTVSNAPISPGQYATIVSAINAASTGDTILIQGTAFNYGSFSVNKNLVFIGPGHNPSDKQNSSPAVLDDISIGGLGSGSKYYGLNVNSFVTSATVTNVVISNCLIRYRIELRHRTSNNWVVDGCIFTSTDINIRGNAQGYGVNNFLARNCVFNGRIWDFPALDNGYNYVTNCVFLKNDGSHSLESTNYFYVTNTIFYRARPTFTGWVSFDKCSSFQTNGGSNAFTANSNGVSRTVYENTDPLFENFPAAGASFNYAHDYRLKSTSPLKNAGTDATDLGVFGGTQFNNILLGYNQNGIPLNPYIKLFNITGSSSVNAGDNLQISVEAKVRN